MKDNTSTSLLTKSKSSFLQDMKDICSEINTINQNQQDIQKLQQIQNNVLQVAGKLKLQKDGRRILESNEAFLNQILTVYEKFSTLNESEEKIIVLSNAKFDLQLKRIDENTFELQTIIKNQKVVKTITNCLHVIFYKNDHSHLKSLAFFEDFNKCFGESLQFKIIFNHIVIPLSVKFNCKYIYLEDQSYFMKPHGSNLTRMYIDNAMKNTSDLQDSSFLFNNDKYRKEHLLYTRFAFGLRKFETYYQNLLGCYPVYISVFYAFQSLMNKDSDIDKIKTVLETIMTLHRILIEFCVTKLTIGNVLFGCSQQNEPKKRKSLDMTQPIDKNEIMVTGRGFRTKLKNTRYNNDGDNYNKIVKEPKNISNTSSSTFSSFLDRNSLDKIHQDTYRQTIYDFVENLNTSVKNKNAKDADYNLADRIFKCLFIYRHNKLFPNPDKKIQEDTVTNMLSKKYLDIVLQPFINISDHKDLLDISQSLHSLDISNSMVIQQNPNQMKKSKQNTTTSSSTVLGANEKVETFIKKMYDNTTEELFNETNIMTKLHNMETDDLLILLKSVLLSWNHYSSKTIKLLI